MVEITPELVAHQPSVKRRAATFAFGMLLMAIAVGWIVNAEGYGIVAAVIAAWGVAAIPFAIVVGLAFTAPAAGEYAETRMTDPKGKVQQMRRKERAEIVEDFRKELKAFALPAIELPKLADGKTMPEAIAAVKASFDQIVPVVNGMVDRVSDENLKKLMKEAYSDIQKAANARGGITPADELTPGEKEELDALAKNPDGKAQLVLVENGLDWLVDQELMKAPLAKKLKKQANAAFLSGRPLDEFLKPYQDLLDRYGGGSGGMVRQTGGAPAGRKIGT